MGHPDLVQGTHEWYVIAQQGDMVVRVQSGMRLGETASGELSFDQSCAQLKLEIADDGDLLVSAVADYELKSAEGTRTNLQRLSRDLLAEVRLAHHALKLATDFITMKKPRETTVVRAVRSIDGVAQRQQGRESPGAAKDGDDTAIARRQPLRGSSRMMPPDRIVPSDVPAIEAKPEPRKSDVGAPESRRRDALMPEVQAPHQRKSETPKSEARAPESRNPVAPERCARVSDAPEPGARAARPKKSDEPKPESTSPESRKSEATPPEPRESDAPAPESRKPDAPSDGPAPTLVRTESPLTPFPRTMDNRATDRRGAAGVTGSRRILMVSTAALVGLAAIGWALLFSTPQEELPPDSSPVVDAGTDFQPTSTQIPPAGIERGLDAAALPSAVPTPAPAVVPESGGEVAEGSSESLPGPDLESLSTVDPIVAEAAEIDAVPAPALPAVSLPEPDPIPTQSAQPDADPDPVAAATPGPDPDRVVPPPVAGPAIVAGPSTPPLSQITVVPESGPGQQTVDPQPDASAGTELEQIRETTQALEAELAERDLLAAELALELGQLVEPPEQSAYTLYSRVLTRYPESPEAKAGLQAVRQGLINRTLAQLAGNELDNARRSLQAAEAAGVNSQLIADLRSEIEYRQRLIDET